MRDTKGKFVKGHKAYDTTGKRPLFHGNSGSFKKGMTSLTKGVPMKDETKEKLSKAKKGQIPWNKGRKETRREVLERQAKAQVGKTPTTETRKKISESNRGEKSYLWKGGKPKCSDCEKVVAYGSKKCHRCSAKKGEESHLWKGGITPINKAIRSSCEYKLWRTAVFERDKFTCVWCGAKFIKGVTGRVTIHADHIKPFCNYPELRFAIDNGRTLCALCHRTTDTYGYKANKKSYE